MSRPSIIVKDEETKRKYSIYDTTYFELKWPMNAQDDFAKKIQKLLDSRKEWPSVLYQEIMRKMRYQKSPNKIALDKIDYTETVLTIADEFLKKNEIRMEPKQKTIEEAAMEKPMAKRAVKPLPRKKA